VDSVIAWAANYLLWVMVVGVAAVWLFLEHREGKLRLGLGAVVGLVVTLVLLFIAGKVHSDPRPFVQNPALKPLIAHAADNGFPSDHSAAAGLIAALVMWRKLWYGLGFGVVAVLVAAARVAAHVHHVQDVIAGLAIGAIGASVGALVAAWLLIRFGSRLRVGRLGRSVADES